MGCWQVPRWTSLQDVAQAVIFLFNLVLLCWILVAIKGMPATQRFARLASFTVFFFNCYSLICCIIFFILEILKPFQRGLL